MTSPIGTTLSTLLSVIEGNLVTAGIFTATQCWIGLSAEEVDPTPGPYIGIIVPGVQEVDQAKQRGIDRNFTDGQTDGCYLKGQFDVVIWASSSLDETTKADIFLTDASLGAIACATAVVNALHMTQLTSGASLLTAEPIRLLKWEKFVKVKEPPNWGYIKLVWEVRWLQALS